MEPLVSILIPTYNRAGLLREAIESALAQTYKNIEVVITDNCSTDNTREVVEALAVKDSRVRFFQNKENVGPLLNWKAALDLAQGEYAKILFSDDLMFPKFIEICLSYFKKNPDYAFVFTNAKCGESLEDSCEIKNWEGEISLGNEISSEEFIGRSLVAYKMVTPTTALFPIKILKSALVTENPYFNSHRYLKNGAGADLLIFLNAAKQFKKIAYDKSYAVFFRESKDSFTTVAQQDPERNLRLDIDYAKACYQFAAENFDDFYKTLFYNYLYLKLTHKKINRSFQTIVDEEFVLKDCSQPRISLGELKKITKEIPSQEPFGKYLKKYMLKQISLRGFYGKWKAFWRKMGI